MYKYRFHGLNFNSEIKFSFLKEVASENVGKFVTSSKPITISLSKRERVENAKEPDAVPGEPHLLYSKDRWLMGSIQKLQEGYVFNYLDQVSFLIKENQIHIFNNRLDVGDLCTLLLSQVVPMTLSLSSDLIVHASAVVINDKVNLFMGLEGAGKSTLATLFHLHGFQVISDDSVRIQFSKGAGSNLMSGNLKVEFGIPEIRIFDQVVEALNLNESQYEFTEAMSKKRMTISDNVKIKESSERRDCTDRGNDVGSKWSVDQIFILDPKVNSTEIKKRKLNFCAAFPLILKSVFRLDVASRERQIFELDSIGKVIQHANVNLLTFPHFWGSKLELLNCILDQKCEKVSAWI